MNITIVPDDNAVGVNGVFYIFPFIIDPTVHAVQWKDNNGVVEYKDKPKEIITDISPYQLILDLWQIEDDLENAAPTLGQNRASEISAIKREAISRIEIGVPALNTFAMVQLMGELWPALNTAALGPEMILAKDIYVYAKSRIAQANSATQAQLDAYDATNDTGWPT